VRDFQEFPALSFPVASDIIAGALPHGRGRCEAHISLLQCGTESQLCPFAKVAARQPAGNYVKLKVEILRLNGGAPEVLHSLRLSSSSVGTVRDSMKGVARSPAGPREANAFRIVSEDGVELYRWPESQDLNRL
jgi:hypothetical protein